MDKTEKFIRTLKIKTKDNRIEPLKLNPPQLRLYYAVREARRRKKPVRIIILKARQMGFSTLSEALIFQDAISRENVNSLIIAHRADSTSNLFRMSKLYYDGLDENIRPMIKLSNAQELLFENPSRKAEDKADNPGLRSRIRCVTAGAKGVGRSDTLTNVHISEYAFWEGDKRSTLIGLLQAVPNLPGTMVIIESTANGYDDFKALWDAAVAGESDFQPLFFPWFDMPGYRMPVPHGTVWSEEELNLAKSFSLDDEQLAWRRWCLKNNCGGDLSLFRQEYPCSPDEAFVTSGSPVFRNEDLVVRRANTQPPLLRGLFCFDYDGLQISGIRLMPDSGGPVTVYSPPEPGVPYVIGGDTAGDGSDWFTAQVLDNRTGKQAAVLRHRCDEGLYARQLYCLGQYYNTALIGVEANYSTFPIRELERLGYPRQYVREAEDTFTGRLRESFGFLTTSVTRPLIIAGLVEVARDSPELICDFDTLGEMLSFVYNSHRRPEAMAGAHDDLVMALAIAHYIRPQQRIATDAVPLRAAWEKDQYEDYFAAEPKTREYLLKKWGSPF